MASKNAIIEAGKLNPTSLLELFILDGRNIGVVNDEPGSDGTFRFHAGTNGILSNIIYNNELYYSFPVEATNFEVNGQNQLPHPVLRCANVRGFMSTFLMENRNLIGAKIYRRRVFAKFIDAVNFENNINPLGTPDTTTHTDDIFYVFRKITENKFFVEFELATQLEIDNVTLPRRKVIATACTWNYRCEGCMYDGIPVADASNKKFSGGAGTYGFTLVDRGEWSASTSYSIGDYVHIISSLETTVGERYYFVCRQAASGTNDYPTSSSKWIPDACSQTIAGCRLRFGENGELPANLYPGLSRLKFA